VTPVCRLCFLKSTQGLELLIQRRDTWVVAFHQVAVALIYHEGVAMAQDVGGGVGVAHGCHVGGRCQVADLVELKGLDAEFFAGGSNGFL